MKIKELLQNVYVRMLILAWLLFMSIALIVTASALLADLGKYHITKISRTGVGSSYLIDEQGVPYVRISANSGLELIYGTHGCVVSGRSDYKIKSGYIVFLVKQKRESETPIDTN